jgi:hypothetical protein
MNTEILAALSYLITKQQLTPAEIQALIKTTINETNESN